MNVHYLNAGNFDDPIGRYPTKTEILKDPRPLFRKEVLDAVSLWKINYFKNWHSKPFSEKMTALRALSRVICSSYGMTVAPVQASGVTHYDRDRGIVCLSTPSVVSLLHELGHHLFGTSEYHACRFSIWLFIVRFKSQVENLQWQEHQLVSA